MKKLVSVLEVLLAGIFILISLLLFLLIDPTGRDWEINLHEGYIIQSSNAEEQSLIRWTKEREEKDSLNPAALILDGTFKKFYADDDYIMIFEMKNKTYYCVNRENEEIIFKSQDEDKVKNFSQKVLGKRNIEWEELG